MPHRHSTSSASGHDRPVHASEPGTSPPKRVRLTFAGLAFATPDEMRAAIESGKKQAQQQIAQGTYDPATTPSLLAPCAIVLRDSRGQYFLMLGGTGGAGAVPFRPGLRADPNDPVSTGGFLPASKIPRRRAADGSVERQRQQIAAAIQQHVVQNQIANGNTSSAPSSNQHDQHTTKGPSELAQIAAALEQAGIGMAEKALAQLLEGDPAAVGGFLKDTLTWNGLANAGLGMGMGMLSSQLMGMWQTDDRSSMGEQLAKHAAEQLLGPLQGHVQDMLARQLNMADPAALANPKSLSQKVEDFFTGPTSEATKHAVCLDHVDVKGNAVATASGDVMVEGKPLAREGDKTKPGGEQVYQGSQEVLTNTKRTAREDSQTTDGKFATKASTVFIGGTLAGPPPPARKPAVTEIAGAAASSARGISSKSEGAPQRGSERDEQNGPTSSDSPRGVQQECDPQLQSCLGGAPVPSQDGQCSVEGLAREVAPFAEHVYNPDTKPLPPGAEQLFYTEGDYGFKGAIYKAVVQGQEQIIVAFGGTDTSGASVTDAIKNFARDMTENTVSGYGTPSQYEQGLDLLHEAMALNPGIPVVVTGHSLGGGIAAFSAGYANVPGIGFNAAGPSGVQIRMDDENTMPKYFVEIQSKGDFLTHNPYLNSAADGLDSGLRGWFEDTFPVLSMLEPMKQPVWAYHPWSHSVYEVDSLQSVNGFGGHYINNLILEMGADRSFNRRY